MIPIQTHYSTVVMTVIISLFILFQSPYFFHPLIGDERIYAFVGGYIFGLHPLPELENQPANVTARYFPNLEHPPLSKLLIGLSILLSGSARIIPTLFGAATLYLVFKFMERFHSKLSGVIAAGILALDPLYFLWSKFAMIDSFNLFFTMLTLTLLVTKPKYTTIAVTLGILTKLTILFTLPVFWLLSPHSKQRKILHLIIIPIISFATITSVYNYLIINDLWNPLLYAGWLVNFHTSAEFSTDGQTIDADPLALITFFIPFMDHPIMGLEQSYHPIWTFITLPLISYTIYFILRFKALANVPLTLLLLLAFTLIPLQLISFGRPLGGTLLFPVFGFLAMLLAWSISEPIRHKHTTTPDSEA